MQYFEFEVFSANMIFQFIHSDLFEISETPNNWSDLDCWSPSLHKLAKNGAIHFFKITFSEKSAFKSNSPRAYTPNISFMPIRNICKLYIF